MNTISSDSSTSQTNKLVATADTRMTFIPRIRHCKQKKKKQQQKMPI